MEIIFPSSRWTTLPAILAYWSSWVTIIMVCPARCSSLKISITPADDSLSRLAVGSSAKSIFGLWATARAMLTLCCSPPDKWLGKLSRRWLSFTFAKASARLRVRFFAPDILHQKRQGDIFKRSQIRQKRIILEHISTFRKTK